MSGPTEFSLESVRQYMLAQDGRVTNHELVKYFKAWLTHPAEKESARKRFKEYVNTLATIKQENGEKYLMLKKRFYPNFDEPPRQGNDNGSSPSLLDEVMSGFQPMHAQQQRRVLPPTPQYRGGAPPSDLGLPTAQPPSQYSSYTPSTPQPYGSSNAKRSSYTSLPPQQGEPAGRIPPPYRPPPYRPAPPPARALPPQPGDLGLPTAAHPSNYGLPPKRDDLGLPSSSNGHYGLPRQNSYGAGPASIMGLTSDYPNSMQRQPSRQSLQSQHSMAPQGHEPPPLPRRNNGMADPRQSQVPPPQQFYMNPAMQVIILTYLAVTITIL